MVDAALRVLFTELEKAELEFRVTEGEPSEDSSSSSKLVTVRIVDRFRSRPTAFWSLGSSLSS